jgi:hypothetical protein
LTALALQSSWFYIGGMTKAPKRPRDPNQLARRIVDLATGEQTEQKSDLSPAQEFARSGGKIGGVARARSQNAFGREIDYAQLVKQYGAAPEPAGRYSPAQCIGTKKRRWIGAPDPDEISTSYAERQNLTMRMHMRRLTRLTNAFSKKAENHAYAVALHFMAYNFCRIHKTPRCSPAMASAWRIVVGCGGPGADD